MTGVVTEKGGIKMTQLFPVQSKDFLQDEFTAFKSVSASLSYSISMSTDAFYKIKLLNIFSRSNYGG